MKIIGYCRVSTDKQDLSLELQKEKIINYCALQNLPSPEIITDEGVSGSIHLRDRPNGCSLFYSGISHIVTMKLDRMFRDASDALNTINHWEDNNTKFSIIDYGGMAMSTASPMGKMIFTMLAGFAEFERNMIRERITQSMQYKRKNGKKFGPAPYGYDEVALSDGSKSLVPNPMEKKWIQWMKDKRKANWSFGHISQWLNDNNISTKHARTWSKSAVKYVVENDLHDTV